MDSYWSKTYDIDSEKHTVELYRYSKNSICVVSTHFFLNGFRNNFEKINGVYNENLKTINKAGFLFSIDDQELLIELLRDIFKYNIKIEDKTEVINEVISLAKKLNKLITDNKNLVYELNENGANTKLSFKHSIDRDNLIINYESSKGCIKLYQSARE